MFQVTLTIQTTVKLRALSKEQVIYPVSLPTNEATNRDVASKLANLLEGLIFPASKDEIKDYLNRKSPAMGNRINDVLEAIQNNLEDGASYDSVYEIEMASGLVKRKDDR
jgi:hypothetical protein